MNAPSYVQSLASQLVAQRFSRTPSFGILSTYAPTACGLATFSSALAEGLAGDGAEVSIVRIADGTPCLADRVVGELVNGSPASIAASAELLNQSDVAILQHEYGIYGGPDGDEILEIMAALRVPSIVIAHTVVKDPTPHQRSVLESVASLADQIVVLSRAAHQRLCADFDVDSRKVVTIAHGATLPLNPALKRSGRPTILTWGLLGPGKGIERVVDAMGTLSTLPGRPRYLIAGQTHPKVLAAEGESYREALAEQAWRIGVADCVSFDAGYRSPLTLTSLIQTSAVVALPYDSTDQVTSGVLVDAIASGRPVVATAFPHAVEMLSSGAGIVVAHDDPDAMASALRKLLTDPRVAGSMAAEARRLAPTIAWPVIAGSYLALAQRLITARAALV